MRVLLVLVLVLAGGCAGETEPDAYGNVEAAEVTVSSEVAGIVRMLAAEEGARLEMGATAAVIDVSQLTLERAQVETQRGTAQARAREAAQLVDATAAQQAVEAAQRDVLTAQRAIAARAYERTRALHAQQAATAQQLDQAERDLRALDEQIEVQTRRIAAQGQQVRAARARAATAEHEIRNTAARLSQLEDRLADAEVKSPIGGTVLTTYVKAGELVQPGQRLYAIADMGTVDVRAYIDETQLAGVRLGQDVTVTFDSAPAARSTRPGTVTWIASQAEFTPTPVQTREERTGLVYAVKIRVANQDGALKIGMPVDVTFAKADR